jgi:hypothetical protein
MIYNRDEFARRQAELIDRINVLSKYYDKDVADYLKSLVSLDETVLKDVDFLDNFGSLDIIYDLMKFNLVGRIYNLIDSDKSLMQNRIASNNSIDTLDIKYERGDGSRFTIVSADLRKQLSFGYEKEQKPHLIVKEVEDRTDYTIESIEKTIERSEDYIAELTEELASPEKPVFSLFQRRDSYNPNSLKRDRIKSELEEIERLKDKIEKTKKYGHLESEICNDIGCAIIEDLGIKPEEFTKSINRSLVKKYKYVDIIKRIR